MKRTVIVKRPQRDRPIRPRPKREREEFGPGKRGIVFCPSCASVYSGKRWRQNLLRVDVSEPKTRLSFLRCPACTMIQKGMFEGRVELIGVPQGRVDDAISRIKNFSRRAQARDPLDRVIAIKRRGNRIEVTTTENQLAVRIAKAVRGILGGKLHIQWTDEDDVVYVTLKLQDV